MINTKLTVGRYEDPAVAVAFFRRTAKLHLRARERFIAKMKRRYREPFILDVGCGIGRDVRIFMNRGLKVVGVDGSHQNLRLAHEKLAIPKHNLIQADVKHMPFPDNLFNGLWLVAVLGHFKDPDNQEVLNELARVAQPGALFFGRVRKGDFSGMQERDGTTRFYRHYQKDHLKTLLQNAGMVNIRFRYASGEPNHPAKEWIHVWANIA